MRSIARPAGGPAGAFTGVILALVGTPPAQGSRSLLPSQLQLSSAERPHRGFCWVCIAKYSEKSRAPRLKREIRLNNVNYSNRISQGARSMTVGRSSFSGRAPENWSASWEIATRRVARVAAIPGGASYSIELVALSAGSDSLELSCAERHWPSVKDGVSRPSLRDGCTRGKA